MVSHQLWSWITSHLRSKNLKNRQIKVTYLLHHVDFRFQASQNELKPESDTKIFNQKGEANQYLISTPDIG